MDKQEIIDLMAGSRSAQEWHDNCERVKAACDGYPDYWFYEIILAGVLDQAKSDFGW